MSVQPGFLERHHFLLRRLHSLTGIVPIGLFLVMHLTTNSSIVWAMANGRAGRFASDGAGRGVATFQEEVTWINSLPALLLIELVLWGSIGFHALFGIYYATTGRPNVRRYAYQDNWRYTLQRVTGYVALLYIFYHVATLRWGWSFLVPGGVAWSHEQAASTLAGALRGSMAGITAMGVVVSVFYFIGITACVYHFANGLWTAAISWGITVSAQAQQRWGRVCTAVGVVMMLMAWSALIGFVVLDPGKAASVEARVHGGLPVLADHAGDAVAEGTVGGDEPLGSRTADLRDDEGE